MKIHAISTGHVKITRSWQIGHDNLRLLYALLDRRFTDWLPIYTWVVEHPEGLMVIDTGIPANANDLILRPFYMPLVQRAAPFKITREQEIDVQLQRLGFSTGNVRWVIQTHLHQDHEGGLHHFPQAQILIARDEWNAAQGFQGNMAGYLNWRWPKWLSPTLVDFEPDPIFRGRHTLTQAGDVHLISTPGHSRGHLSVLIDEGEQAVFIAGDTSYTQDLLVAGKVDGVGVDAAAERDTHRRILQFAVTRPTVYLPSHDPDAERRLEQREPLASYQPA